MNEMMKNNMWFKTAFLTFVFCALGFVESRADIQLTVDVANKTASTVVVVYQTTIRWTTTGTVAIPFSI